MPPHPSPRQLFIYLSLQLSTHLFIEYKYNRVCLFQDSYIVMFLGIQEQDPTPAPSPFTILLVSSLTMLPLKVNGRSNKGINSNLKRSLKPFPALRRKRFQLAFSSTFFNTSSLRLMYYMAYKCNCYVMNVTHIGFQCHNTQ